MNLVFIATCGRGLVGCLARRVGIYAVMGWGETSSSAASGPPKVPGASATAAASRSRFSSIDPDGAFRAARASSLTYDRREPRKGKTGVRLPSSRGLLALSASRWRSRGCAVHSGDARAGRWPRSFYQMFRLPTPR